ncbi:hypothetical protein GRS96_01890 [Rathayibacter sp. VKM Ac-2803]|uniref:DUF7882 family protein n=1 Tax=unclassified Rathayibacter TaxID=2609250 RepID=UPI00135774E3|nr:MULTISPECIES: hypothetical protein [unclassified Rathayibacter]MWV48024.1 hypothetical protein [Rathayibacter sp. VKM Ac-2803]MWV58752.1 hypothetical protein [Rathayibacter sp. VKM Ac-2754]
MGQLIYGIAPAIMIDDRALRHAEAVIISKLRRNESFSFHWDGEPHVGEDVAIENRGKHGSIWVSKSSSLYFSYDEYSNEPLNRAWIDLLLRAAATPAGLRVLPEPGTEG